MEGAFGGGELAYGAAYGLAAGAFGQITQHIVDNIGSTDWGRTTEGVRTSPRASRAPTPAPRSSSFPAGSTQSLPWTPPPPPPPPPPTPEDYANRAAAHPQAPVLGEGSGITFSPVHVSAVATPLNIPANPTTVYNPIDASATLTSGALVAGGVTATPGGPQLPTAPSPSDLFNAANGVNNVLHCKGITDCAIAALSAVPGDALVSAFSDQESEVASATSKSSDAFTQLVQRTRAKAAGNAASPVANPSAPIHLALGIRDIVGGEKDILDKFADKVGAVTYKGDPFVDLFPPPARQAASTPGSYEQMIDRVIASKGRISFNMQGINNPEDMLLVPLEQRRPTTIELQRVCNDPEARSITSFHNGAAPC